MRTATLTLVLLAALALTATGHAREPAGVPEPTGSISGRLVFDGPQPDYEFPQLPYRIWVIPADTPQPINLLENTQNLVLAEANGEFLAGGLADGDYFVFPLWGLVSSTPPPESISVVGTAGLDPSERLAVRVTVADGQAVTGIEMVVPVPEQAPTPTPMPPPEQLSPPVQLSPPSQMTLPAELAATGAGPVSAGAIAAYVGLGIAALAVLLLAGGVAMRLRGRP